ncbi:hypothetical protein L6164_012139 [Bauhinia variegata]|uniref:Uncharacterized protein n=1 Tax=Bauhinia variegata TaxID=167791 RepID=A0ACB9P861_BAUVA|nr:hypothetical protein L6164_012139 [Bauhinia variegata]
MHCIGVSSAQAARFFTSEGQVLSMNSWGSSGGQEANMRGFLPREEIDVLLGIKLPFAEGNIPVNENLHLEAINYAQFDHFALISPRKFEEAKNNAGRSALRSHAETRSFPVTNNNNDGTPDQPVVVVDCELSLRVGDSRKKQKTDDSDVFPPVAAVSPSSHPPEPPKLKLGCVICMCELTDATTTKCGHIFCRVCLMKAIISQHKCPTCRRKLRKNDMIRLYLPEPIM